MNERQLRLKLEARDLDDDEIENILDEFADMWRLGECDGTLQEVLNESHSRRNRTLTACI
jgi:hypothetical protein